MRFGQSDEDAKSRNRGVEVVIKFIIRRLLLMIPVILGVLIVVFTLNYFTPGDPVLGILGNDATDEQYAALEKELGLDKPYIVQLFNYLKGVVTEFNLGTSFQTKRSVSKDILQRFPTTLKLGLMSVALTLILGLPFGIIAATKQYSRMDYGVTFTSLFFASVPGFWLALMLIILFALNLRLVPATGLGNWKGYILPVVAMGLGPVAMICRMTRSSMLEVIRQDYIRTARAKGLSEGTVIRRHALKNSLIPVVTVVGFQLGIIFGGSAIIETIFTIPGIGTLMLAGINQRDYPVVQGCVLFISTAICVMNLLVDIAYGFIDPRIMARYTVGSSRKKTEKILALKSAEEDA